jgi:hypothetical protein
LLSRLVAARAEDSTLNDADEAAVWNYLNGDPNRNEVEEGKA